MCGSGLGLNCWGSVASPKLPELLAGIPRIGGFSRPTLKKIISLEPDLIIATSDAQADTVAVSLKAGLPVLAAANLLAIGFATELASLRLPRAAGTRPAIFFEEWPDPLVGGIGWGGDLIDHLGGLDVFSELRSKPIANERPVEVLA